eukprot:18929-Rhodomonas_salina.8
MSLKKRTTSSRGFLYLASIPVAGSDMAMQLSVTYVRSRSNPFWRYRFLFWPPSPNLTHIPWRMSMRTRRSSGFTLLTIFRTHIAMRKRRRKRMTLPIVRIWRRSLFPPPRIIHRKVAPDAQTMTKSKMSKMLRNIVNLYAKMRMIDSNKKIPRITPVTMFNGFRMLAACKEGASKEGESAREVGQLRAGTCTCEQMETAQREAHHFTIHVEQAIPAVDGAGERPVGVAGSVVVVRGGPFILAVDARAELDRVVDCQADVDQQQHHREALPAKHVSIDLLTELERMAKPEQLGKTTSSAPHTSVPAEDTHWAAARRKGPMVSSGSSWTSKRMCFLTVCAPALFRSRAWLSCTTSDPRDTSARQNLHARGLVPIEQTAMKSRTAPLTTSVKISSLLSTPMILSWLFCTATLSTLSRNIIATTSTSFVSSSTTASSGGPPVPWFHGGRFTLSVTSDPQVSGQGLSV